MPRICRERIPEALMAHLVRRIRQREISAAQLVDWAERAIMESDFAEPDISDLREVVSRLGVADVRTFGIAWEDCEQMLRQLGYTARVDVGMA